VRHLGTDYGVRTDFAHDSKTGKNILRHVQDVEPYLQFNAHAAQHLDKSKNWWFVGTIPDAVILQWAEECKAKPYSRKWRRYAEKQLNKPEYRKLNPNKIRLGTRER
jgi:hypothetical protein